MRFRIPRPARAHGVPRRHRGATRSLPVTLALLGLLAAACQGRLDHVFGGYGYDPTQDCLYTSGAIDVIAGADPGQCPMLRCWKAPDGSIYVTDEACDAPSDYLDQTHDASSLCVKALAAYDRLNRGLCPVSPDGGGGAGGGGP